MAVQMLYMGASTVSLVNGMSTKLVFSSLELCISAANLAVHSLRPSPSQPAITDNALVKDDLESLDIEAKLKTISALVQTIQRQQQHRHARGGEEEGDVVDVALGQVKEVLDSLTLTFHELEREIAEHDTRWFSSWRQANTASLVTAIKSKMFILDKRVDMLLKVRAFVLQDAN